MDALLGDLLKQYGVFGLIVILAAVAAFYFMKARAKTTEANAAEKSADAIAVTTVSNATAKLIEHLLSALETTKETQRAITETQHAMTATLAEMLALLKTSAASGAVIATQMEAGNVAQAAAQVASTLTNTAIDATQTKILEHLESLKTAIDLLTAALKKGDAVDDESREDILKRLATLEQLLKQKTEKAKEKQDEQAEPQTTVNLTGHVTGVLNTGDDGDDGAG